MKGGEIKMKFFSKVRNIKNNERELKKAYIQTILLMIPSFIVAVASCYIIPKIIPFSFLSAIFISFFILSFFFLVRRLQAITDAGSLIELRRIGLREYTRRLFNIEEKKC